MVKPMLSEAASTRCIIATGPWAWARASRSCPRRRAVVSLSSPVSVLWDYGIALAPTRRLCVVEAPPRHGGLRARPGRLILRRGCPSAAALRSSAILRRALISARPASKCLRRWARATRIRASPAAAAAGLRATGVRRAIGRLSAARRSAAVGPPSQPRRRPAAQLVYGRGPRCEEESVSTSLTPQRSGAISVAEVRLGLSLTLLTSSALQRARERQLEPV